MTIEYSPAQQEVFSKDPDWSKAAQLIAEQSGCENFPVSTVDKILAKPGELIVGALSYRENFFAIGAIIAAKDQPFSPLGSRGDRGLTALRIEPEHKEYTKGHYMHAEREISFSLAPDASSGTSNWMGPGIHYRNGEPNLTILAADELAPELAIGTDEVNAFFEKLVKNERLAPHKDRLVGMLFQTARLAMDFDAPTPVAPEELQPEVSQANAYYQAAQAHAQMIVSARKYIESLEEQQTHRSVIPYPAIYYERPLDLPAVADIQEAKRRLARTPTDSEIRDALRSYDKVIKTLDALRTE